MLQQWVTLTWVWWKLCFIFSVCVSLFSCGFLCYEYIISDNTGFRTIQWGKNTMTDKKILQLPPLETFVQSSGLLFTLPPMDHYKLFLHLLKRWKINSVGVYRIREPNLLPNSLFCIWTSTRRSLFSRWLLPVSCLHFQWWKGLKLF